jgi:hypothetical protein
MICFTDSNIPSSNLNTVKSKGSSFFQNQQEYEKMVLLFNERFIVTQRYRAIKADTINHCCFKRVFLLKIEENQLLKELVFFMCS